MIPSVFATEWALGNLQSEAYHLTLEQIFGKVRDFGVGHVHLVYRWNFEKEDVPRIRSLIDQYEVQVSCTHSLTRLNRPNSSKEFAAEREQLKDAIRFAKTFDSKFVACNYGENLSRDEATGLRECKREYGDCVALAADEGITIIVENTCVATADEITATADGVGRLIEAMDSRAFKFHFDPGNMYAAGDEAYPYAYEQLKGHIAFVHGKDMAKYDERIDLHRRALQAHKQLERKDGYCVSVPLGTGALNWEALFAALLRDGYDGFFDIEPHTVQEELDAFYRTGLDYFAQRTAR